MFSALVGPPSPSRHSSRQEKSENCAAPPSPKGARELGGCGATLLPPLRSCQLSFIPLQYFGEGGAPRRVRMGEVERRDFALFILRKS